MLFSYNWLKDYLKGKMPSPKKLAELLTRHSFEVESVTKKGKDWVLDIDVLPNRAPDCLSHIGIARECAAIMESEMKVLEQRKLKVAKSKIKPIDLKIRCSQLVPRYSAIVIEGVKVASSPRWLRERLKTVGVRPINNIVDLTNFVMLETGQPLHAFDYDKIREQKMILRQSRQGEKVITLDDVKRILDKGILVIEDRNRLIDLVGIMGGKLSEIGRGTKNVVLQAGNFNARTIYLTSKKLKHSTNASNIYTQGIDPNITIPTLERVYFLLKQIGGGEIVQIIDIYPKKVLPKKIKLNLNYVEKLLGIKVSKNKVKNILQKLGFKVTETRPPQLKVEVPTRRLDVSIQEDLIEEIGRIIGFQDIPSTFPQAALISPEKNEELFWQRNIKNILKEAGLSEVYNYSFMGEKQQGIFNWPKGDLTELANPMSSFNRYLRPSLIPNLLKNIKDNLKHFDQIKLFEVGKIFTKKQNLREKKMLTGILTRKGIKDEGFYELKGMVDSLLAKLGIADVWYDDYLGTPELSEAEIWHPQKSAEIKSNGKEIGFLGEIHPRVTENLDIKERVFIFDISFEKLLKLASEEHEYQPISVFPAAIRDLAILVPRGTKVVEILNKMNIGGGKLVRDIDLFDIYSGQGIPQGKENFAFHIIYQARDRTLSSKEIDEIHQRIIKALEENPAWEVRR